MTYNETIFHYFTHSQPMWDSNENEYVQIKVEGES